MLGLTVERIDREQVRALVDNYHYSRKTPGIKYAWGLVNEVRELVGCVVYSIPASYTLCKGVCGEQYKRNVLELSRLVIIIEEKNAASFLVGTSLKELGKIQNTVVVSYADCNTHVGHIGYIYQATNWHYTGQGSCEPAWAHPTTGQIISYTRRHIDIKARAAGFSWIGGTTHMPLKKIKQQGKHRYVTFAGSKKFRVQALRDLRYGILPYPKGATLRHVVKAEIKRELDPGAAVNASAGAAC